MPTIYKPTRGYGKNFVFKVENDIHQNTDAVVGL